MCKHDYLGQLKISFVSEAPNDSLLRAVHSLFLVPFKSKALLSSQVVSRLIAIFFISESFAKGCDMGFLTMRFKAHVGRDFSAKFKQRFRVFFFSDCTELNHSLPKLNYLFMESWPHTERKKPALSQPQDSCQIYDWSEKGKISSWTRGNKADSFNAIVPQAFPVEASYMSAL